LILEVAINPILAILAPFPLAPPLLFLSLFASVTHTTIVPQLPRSSQANPGVRVSHISILRCWIEVTFTDCPSTAGRGITAVFLGADETL
jgi:hypothetical protein